MRMNMPIFLSQRGILGGILLRCDLPHIEHSETSSPALLNATAKCFVLITLGLGIEVAPGLVWPP